MKIVSACLAGIQCNWKGKSKPCQKIIDLVISGKAIPVCPEQLGGLPTPREAAEQNGDKVITASGEDVTDKFKLGAKEGLRIANLVGCKEAILTARSPSCGVDKVYDGTFTHNIIEGDGVFAKLLKENGIEVTTDEECRC